MPDKTIKPNPYKCMVGDLTPKEKLRDWPFMTRQAVVAFKRFTGHTRLQGELVRRGPLIFLVGEAEHAECMYTYPREFK